MAETAALSERMSDFMKMFREVSPSFTILKVKCQPVIQRNTKLTGKNLRKCTRPQRTHGQKNADNGLLRRQFVDGESMEVDDKDHHRKRNSDSPEDVTGDDCCKCLRRVGENIGHDCPGPGSNNTCDNRHEPDCRHGRKVGVVLR